MSDSPAPSTPNDQPAPEQPATDAGKFGPPKPGAPRLTGPRNAMPQSRSSGPGPRGDRPRDDGSAPKPLTPQDFFANKPNKRELDADIEAELAAALGGADLSSSLGAAETRQRPTGSAPSINKGTGRKQGTVIGIRGKDVFIDLPGGRTQGVLPLMQFEGVTPQIGDPVEVSIERFDGANGLLVLTMAGAAQQVSDWSSVAEHMIVEVRVTGVNKNRSGLLIEVSGLKGFMPISQIDLYRVEDLDQYVNQTMKAEIIELNREERNLLVSRKILLEREREAQREKFWAELAIGQTRTGTVRNLQPFGAFVDLGGADGLIPVSEMSWKRVNHPSDVLQIGQKVEVIVRRLDHEQKRISLSLRQLVADPFDTFAASNRPGSVLKGKVTKIAEFGAFVEVADGVDGLVHISELSTERVRRVRDVVKEGQEVEVQIVNIDRDGRKVALSMKTVQAGAMAVQEAAEQAEDEAERAATAERLASRPINTKLRGGGGGGFNIVWPGS